MSKFMGMWRLYLCVHVKGRIKWGLGREGDNMNVFLEFLDIPIKWAKLTTQELAALLQLEAGGVISRRIGKTGW